MIRISAFVLAACGLFDQVSADSNGVSVRLMNYHYIPNPNTCDILNGACDVRFTVDYKWNANSARLTIPEVDNKNTIDFQLAPKILNGPLRAGTVISVTVVAKDIDIGASDDIGRFDFQYIVPTEASGSVIEHRMQTGPKGEWNSDFRIEFEALF